MSKIPKIIHQVFFEGEEAIPDKYRHYRETIRDNHPHWEYSFWDEAKARDFMGANYAWFMPVFDAYPYPIQRWDAIRYFILYHYGGFYMDMDIECLKPIDNLLENFELVLSKLVDFSNAIMGSVPGHPLWPKVFEEMTKRKDMLPKRNERFPKSMPYDVCYSTGPILLDDCIKAGKFHKRATVRVCPGSIFEPGAPMELDGKIVKRSITKEAYTIHHMTTSWLPLKDKINRAIFSVFAKMYWSLPSRFRQKAIPDE